MSVLLCLICVWLKKTDCEVRGLSLTPVFRYEYVASVWLYAGGPKDVSRTEVSVHVREPSDQTERAKRDRKMRSSRKANEKTSYLRLSHINHLSSQHSSDLPKGLRLQQQSLGLYCLLKIRRRAETKEWRRLKTVLKS